MKTKLTLRQRFFRPKNLLITFGSLGLVLSFQACGGFASKAVNGLVSSASVSARDSMVAATCKDGVSAGHVAIHRLNNEEYDNTVRDLLYTSKKPSTDFSFSKTPAGLSGFTNDSNAISLGTGMAESLYGAAVALADEVIASSGGANGSAYSKLVKCDINSATCSSSSIQAFATRAFRRPPTANELTNLKRVFAGETAAKDGFHDVIVSVLMSPNFLFNYVDTAAPVDPNFVHELNPYELATRLSYFLWQSMPDDQLFSKAADGTLAKADVQESEVRRMLKDAKAAAVVKALVNDWLGLGAFATSELMGGLTQALRADMIKESEMLIQDIVQNDKSLLNAVTANYSYLSKPLASHYGLAPPSQTDANGFGKVPYANGDHRQGVVSHASILTAFGGFPDTHPVRRGKWVLERIFCAAPPPPPPNTPSLPSASDTPNLTVRQRLEQHVANASCNACHKDMDNLGLGLENYDSFGKWRTAYSDNGVIDPKAATPDGTTFVDANEMITNLAKDPNVASCLTRQLTSYALTRAAASRYDKCVSGLIGSTSMKTTKTFSEVIVSITNTVQFRAQVGEAE
jgi:hypothetical protein